MKLSQFKFRLPQEQIALYPSSFMYDDDGKIVYKSKDNLLADRDECRLLVLHSKTGDIEHKIFKELYTYFDEGDLFVLNDAQVFPAVMCGNKEKTNANIEVFLLRELNPRLKLWDVLVEPARKIRVGNKLYFGPDNSLVAEVIDNTTARGRTVRFLYDGSHDEFKRNLFALGTTPLPKHIHRPAEPDDAERFQTIFASKEGAVVAPAAGCNFTRELLKRLEIVGASYTFTTLYSSVSIFNEIDVEDLSKHKMESEQIEVNDEVCNLFNQAYRNDKKICAVGTTVLRTLESAATTKGLIKPFSGWTNRFIFPPYEFNTANCLISNLQLPQSIMLMNQCAFGGYRKVMDAYQAAIHEGYRFGFYGDAIMILPD
ncbi:MAG: tRNA preQ1(34) S-adenosylmethionine ribosyltransferase-isomerase QueA [Paludibacteraceae bacterium]|nr:tRNA preQ1(34) S-adenosylmethionine ribosyltransferase-isomerase QueA [Paludibacteraceae bacterium]